MKKNSLVLIILSFWVVVGCRSSSKEESKPPLLIDTIAKSKSAKDYPVPIDTPSYATGVGKYRDSIDKNLPTFKERKQDVPDGSAEGGEISIYMNNRDTVKVKALYYGETGKSEYQIYLRNHAIISFKEKLFYYKSPVGKNPVKIDSIRLRDFILKDGTVLLEERGKDLLLKNNYGQKSIDIKDIYKEIIFQLMN